MAWCLLGARTLQSSWWRSPVGLCISRVPITSTFSTLTQIRWQFSFKVIIFLLVFSLSLQFLHGWNEISKLNSTNEWYFLWVIWHYNVYERRTHPPMTVKQSILVCGQPAGQWPPWEPIYHLLKLQNPGHGQNSRSTEQNGSPLLTCNFNHVNVTWDIVPRFELLHGPVSIQCEAITGLILGLHPANERRRYKVTPSLIGWAQT